MPDTVPAAATGLPNSCLIETDRGLAVSRLQAARALRPSMLAGDALDAFLAKLDEFISAGQQEHHLRERFGYPEAKQGINDADETARKLRRFMIIPIRTIRMAKAKNLDDILFKAVVTEIIDPFGCRRSESIPHSIVNDLLSADCQWRV